MTSLHLGAQDGGVCAGLEVPSVDRAPVGLVLAGHNRAPAHQGAGCQYQREEKYSAAVLTPHHGDTTTVWW